MILDILFFYCKFNFFVGGYCQGMYELFVLIVYVVVQDLVDGKQFLVVDIFDFMIVELLDVFQVEYDFFVLFFKVMDCVGVFYEVE